MNSCPRPLLDKLEQIVCEIETHSPAHADGEIIHEIVVDQVRYRISRYRDTLKPLSARQMQILELIAQGHPNKQIGLILGIQLGTIDEYLGRMFLKLEACSRPHLVAQAYEKGLLPQVKKAQAVN